ncbi:hypothetical protein RhiirA5_426371 [Rhizophagus irregularis]|uniref:Uncharacterized protein n=1 Tax=Rhizophagus irregularis TaxID=588596 RepID=A0A2N0P4E3_9GLOM|nr:hypothetical protein RhiirA5_426371 [Rhizophagus irregularis]PKC72162.1 hypothetical protein RhiirA1_452633 [Rhizophagus irregularis]
MSYNNKDEIVQLETEFNELNISDRNPNFNHEDCYKLKGWTSENNGIDEFIKDTIYNAKNNYFYNGKFYPKFLEWVPFDLI